MICSTSDKRTVINWACHCLVLLTVLFLMPGFLGAQTFNFAVDSFHVDGNLLGLPEGITAFFDDFNNGSVTGSPTGVFGCDAGDVPTESGSFLLLRRADVIHNRYTDAQGNTFLVMNCVLGFGDFEGPFFLLQRGRGGSNITASFRADVPDLLQSYGLQLSTLVANELVNIQVGYGGGGTNAGITAVAQTASGSRITQRMVVNFANAQRINLRLSYNDASHIVTPSFSIDNGPQITITLTQPGTVMTTGNQAAASVFGSVVLPPGVNADDKVITNYQLVSQQPAAGTKSYLAYRADLVNPGVALGAVTATLDSLDPFTARVLPGQDTLTFAPVPAHSQVTSNNTLTILADPSVPLDFSKFHWTFQTSPAPPVANPGLSQIVAVGSTATLDGSGSMNPSGVGTLTYSWVFTSRPFGTATRLFYGTSVMPTFVADAAGIYVITLTVSNGVASSSGNVTVTAAAATAGVQPPTGLKRFNPGAVDTGGTSTLTILITNTNPVNFLFGVGLIDTMPAGLIVSAMPNLINSCGGTVSGATPASTAFSLSGAILPGGASCIVSLSVTDNNPPNTMAQNCITVVSQNGGFGNQSCDTLLTLAHPPMPIDNRPLPRHP